MSFNELPPTPDEPNWVQPADQQAAPADPSQGRGRRAFKAGAWMVAGAVAATVITGVAFANSTSPSPSSAGSGGSNSSSAPKPSGTANPNHGNGHGMPGGFGKGMGGGPGFRGGMGGFGGLGMLGGRVLHGEASIQTKDGVKDMVEQTGALQGGVTSNTITVKSTDGFTKTWTLSSTVKVFAPRAHSFTKPTGSPSPKPTVKPTAPSSSGSISDLINGANVTVVGENKNGTWTAEYIIVMPKGTAKSGSSSSPSASTASDVGSNVADVLTAFGA